jgi:alkylation response protein AidB-like acyl-CoA dehydrogenase
LAKIIDLATIAVAAEQLGGCQQALDSTVAYTGERVQFNRKIASFQAVKHKAADMMVKTEAARSAVYYAACVAQGAMEDDPLGAELAEAASIAKAWCSDACFFNAGTGIQLHGGVGFTWEYDIQLYFKRAKSSETFLGNSVWHRERIARQLLD